MWVGNGVGERGGRGERNWETMEGNGKISFDGGGWELGQ